MSDLLQKFHDIFYGKINYSTKCEKCGKISNRQEIYTFLNLPIKNFKTFYDAYNSEYLKSEKLEKDCQYLCGNCNTKTNAIRSCQIRSLPSYLHLQLIRYDMVKNDKVKLLQGMAIPRELDSQHLNLVYLIYIYIYLLERR